MFKHTQIDNLEVWVWVMILGLSQIAQGVMLLLTLGTISTDIPVRVARMVARARSKGSK